MEPFILATGILIGSALNQGTHDHHRHRHVEHRVHYHSADCPDAHFRTSITFRSPRPRYRHYRTNLRPVTYRRHHYHRTHSKYKPRVRRSARYRSTIPTTRRRVSHNRLRKI